MPGVQEVRSVRVPESRVSPLVSDVDVEKPPVVSAANELPAPSENPVESDNNVKDFSDLVGVLSRMLMAFREKRKP